MQSDSSFAKALRVPRLLRLVRQRGEENDGPINGERVRGGERVRPELRSAMAARR